MHIEQNNNKWAWDIVLENQGLIHKFLKKKTFPKEYYEDLEQELYIALFECVPKLNSKKGKLSTLAEFYFLHYYTQYMRNNLYPVVYSSTVYEDFSKLSKRLASLGIVYPTYSKLKMICEEMGLSDERTDNVINFYNMPKENDIEALETELYVKSLAAKNNRPEETAITNSIINSIQKNFCQLSDFQKELIETNIEYDGEAKSDRVAELKKVCEKYGKSWPKGREEIKTTKRILLKDYKEMICD